MSSPAPDPPSTPPSAPPIFLPSFGGYLGQPDGLPGVSFWPRVGARAIDAVLHYVVSFFSGILFVILLAAASGGHISPELSFKMRHTDLTGVFLALLGSVAYHVICSSIHGSSLGKLALSLVVVQEDGSPCRFGSAVIRELAYFVDGLFFGLIGYLAMQKTPQEQRHGDEWAHTVVRKRASLPPEKCAWRRPIYSGIDVSGHGGRGAGDGRFATRDQLVIGE
jgi:uncharacterized RDD family membrane protein YckC